MSVSRASAALTAPRTIAGRYELVEQIGRGGMATVHRAVHMHTRQTVALKLLTVDTKEDGETTASQAARFEREARFAGGIDTHHITRVLDAGVDTDSGARFLVMELLTGEDVAKLVRRNGPFRPTVAMKIVAQACVGLAKAHAARIVHRDVKPSNLFLAQGESADEVIVKLLDFGIAKATTERIDSAENSTLTQTGALVGTPHYMSPEQAMSSRKLDHRTDLWSLGVVLYKCLSGRTPFDERETMGQLIVALVSEHLPSVQNFAPWVPPEVAEVVGRALQRDVSARYASAEQMLEALMKLLPGGRALTREDLSPMTDEERMRVAPRRSLQPGALGSDDATLDLPKVSATQVKVYASGNSLTTGGLDVSSASMAEKPASPKPSGLRWMVSGIASGLVLVGAVVAMSRSSTPVDTPAPIAPTPPTPEHSASVHVDAPPPRAAPVAQRTVQVNVPSGISRVEVDGVEVSVVDGTVAVSGELGSVHRVRAESGTRSATTEIAITAHGPRPSSIAMPPAEARPAAAPPSPARRAAPAAPAQAPTAGPAPTTAAPPASKFDQTFE